MKTRAWIVVGTTCGLAALILLAVLATLAVGTDMAMTPGLMVLGLLDMMLWQIALKTIGDIVTARRLEHQTAAYASSVEDTVDRIVAAMPGTQKVRQIR